MEKHPKQIDLGLSVLCVVAKRDQTLTLQAIADVCGCSKMYVGHVEKRALLKAREQYKKIGYNKFIYKD